MIVQICVGSSCHLVERMKQAVSEHSLEDEITLAGSFCIGKCNRVGVTIQVDDEVYTGVTPASFDEFFRNHILGKLKS